VHIPTRMHRVSLIIDFLVFNVVRLANLQIDTHQAGQ
jgi:hypothetical protein